MIDRKAKHANLYDMSKDHFLRKPALCPDDVFLENLLGSINPAVDIMTIEEMMV